MDTTASQPVPTLIEGPVVPEPVEEVLGVNTPGVSQWAINVITTQQLIHDFDAGLDAR